VALGCSTSRATRSVEWAPFSWLARHMEAYEAPRKQALGALLSWI
jgi:hypothetical protein